VGRYVEKKGFADLIEACRHLRARGRKFECAIVGGGPLDTVLQTRIERASLGEAVRLLGARPQHEVRALLAGSGIFVLASVPETTGGSDNLPTVILEAMLTGLPVVSTKVAGIPEMVSDGETGCSSAQKSLRPWRWRWKNFSPIQRWPNEWVRAGGRWRSKSSPSRKTVAH
jgi:glycosyltransferase involved in cell wall biosynthesis